MAVQGASQALVAAFIFGMVVNAASAALFLFTRGLGPSIFRDGPRLVLVTFLLISALWALIDFITTVLDTANGTAACQVGLIFATLFDQLGRFAMEQYLLWAMVTPGKSSAAEMAMQALIAARFVVGGVFVGFTRPQADTFCVARSSVLPVAIAVIVLDGVIIASLAARAFMAGLVADVRQGKAASSRSKCILFVMAGFVIWTATSVAMMLGMTTVNLIFRTALPAIGLSILIVIVTACSGGLDSPRGSQSSPPEAPSPRRINISRDISTADSSQYPPSRYEDLKDQAIRSSTAFLRPREAPRASEDVQALPRIARPITGVAGVGGVPVQGALFPPTRAMTETAPMPEPARIPSTSALKQKRGLFDFGKGSGGKLTIGNPILLDNDDQNPLNKIATIDLQEAARAEQDRRAMALKRGSDLVAKRPAPQPPNVTPEEALKRSVSLKRKGVASVLPPPPAVPAGLQPVSTSSTTSAQLSPGVEEIRRRSPRQLPADAQDRPLPQRPISPPKAEEPRAVPVPAEYTPAAEQRFVASPVQIRPVTPPVVDKPRDQSPPQPPTVRPGIRPSRKLSSPKKDTAAPGPPKTPLQRRPTTGLPGGPRARKLNVDAQQQTVMFVNNIVYDDPNEVQRIIDGANDRVSKAAPRPRTPESSASVVHRPRPVPRKSELDTDEARKHMRSRSGGSLVSRKSILMSTAGSPTQLPPLPPPPKSAGMPSRPQPNDTASMTVDEKMGLFYPPTPRQTDKRRSSVPELPPVPGALLGSNSSPAEEAGDHRRSNRTTKTSVQTENLFEVEDFPANTINVGRLSPEASYVADEVGRSWLPGIADSQASTEGGAGKRGSSPVIPLRESAWTETTDSKIRDTRDDSTSNWGSLYSPEVAVGIQVAAQVARATSIRRGASQNNAKGKGRPPAVDERSSGEIVDFVLDAGLEGELRADDERWVSGHDSMLRPERASQWHRRVGDECPSFSERKEKTRSRKGPPPTPLLLNAGSNRKTTVVHTAEPSPIEEPEQALQQIQAQLRRIEQPSRDSVESQGQRLALLENLEKEIGMQENHWLEMQLDLGRRSTSSIGTVSSNRTSRRESVIAPALREAPLPPKANIAQERRDMRRSRFRSGSTAKSGEPAQLQVPVSPRASAWQQKLAQAEAEMEFMDDSRDGSRLRSFNFFTVSKVQLGSPTPPDSDQSDSETATASDLPMRPYAPVVAQGKREQPQRHLLWVPARTVAAHRSSGLLWCRPPTTKPQEAEPSVLPGLSVRPRPRKEESAPLRIASAQLWRKPYRKAQPSTLCLWRPSWAQSNLATTPPSPPSPAAAAAQSKNPNNNQPSPSSAAPPRPQQRPLTQRPPRRNRRVTLLPDIVEDPQPLPDRRDTLGIFQFPWGERSDTASVAPAPAAVRPSTSRMAMPGTMTSGGGGAALRARARELEAAEYASSFFDEYDDDDVNFEGEDEERDETGSEDEEELDSGDDFDENTLWEIASLLKTDGIPSKASLFPPPVVGEVVDDYLGDIPSDDDGSDGREWEDEIVIGLSEEQTAAPGLWRPREMTRGRGEHGPGLPDSDERTWLEYAAAAAAPFEGVMVRTRLDERSVIESDSLWTPENKKADVAPMWIAGSRPTKIPQPAEAKNMGKNRKYHALASLWDKPASTTESASARGLFKIDPQRSVYRTTSAEPAAKHMSRRLRPAEHKPLDRLVSTGLWTKTPNHKARFHQLSHGMWSPPQVHRPTEPSGLFTVDRSRSDWRTTSAEPAARTMDRKARPTERKPLDKLTSVGLWAAARPRQHAERNWLASPKHLPRPPASKADWSAALASALSASYPPAHHPHRTAATPSDWASALSEAVAQSYPVPSPLNDSSTTHPVFFAPSALATSSTSFHPAATGYTHDVAAVHPAFFGSLAVTCRADAAHPAVAEYAAAATESAERERREREALAERVRLLEEEKAFVARMAGEIYRDRIVGGGSLEGEDGNGEGEVGVSRTATTGGKAEQRAAVVRDVGEEVSAVVGEEAEGERVARKKSSRGRREREERRAEILAKIRAIEQSEELDTFGARGRDEKQGESRKSGVVLRY